MILFNPKYTPQFDNFTIPHPEELKNIPDYDLLSPCEFYRVMDKECRTIANETSVIWATGKRAECDEWKKAFENCQKWESSKDRDALENVLNFERTLFKLRQIDIALNDVWKPRESNGKEPAFFNAPLPRFLQKP